MMFYCLTHILWTISQIITIAMQDGCSLSATSTSKLASLQLPLADSAQFEPILFQLISVEELFLLLMPFEMVRKIMMIAIFHGA